MHFSTAVTALAVLASSAAAQKQIENIASFETYPNANCTPQSNQRQNINSNECKFLPDLSAQVYFLEKTRGNCQLQFFTSGDCTGTPANVITSAPSACLDVSNKFSFIAICS